MTHRVELVQTRVKPAIKKLAAEKAEYLGLSLSTIVSIFITKFAFEGELPAVRPFLTPNEETLSAIADADSHEGEIFKTPETLFKHLGI